MDRPLAVPHVAPLAAAPVPAVPSKAVDACLGVQTLAVQSARLGQGLVAGVAGLLDRPDMAAGLAVAEVVPRGTG